MFYLGISFFSFWLIIPFSIPIDNDEVISSAVKSLPLIVHCEAIQLKNISLVDAQLYSGLFLFSAY